MKKILIALLIINYQLSIVNCSFAQVADKKASAILDEVSNKTKSYKNIKIDFSYKMENKADNINESKDGTIYLKGDKYNLNISGQNVICDGKTVWTYIKEADEIHINNVNPDEDALSFNKLMSNFNKDYKSKLIKQDKLNGEDVYVIDLTPVKGKSYHKVRLLISVAKKQVMSATIFDKNNTTYVYSVKKFLPDTSIKDELFTFKSSDHPKAEVIDMR